MRIFSLLVVGFFGCAGALMAQQQSLFALTHSGQSLLLLAPNPWQKSKSYAMSPVFLQERRLMSDPISTLPKKEKHPVVLPRWESENLPFFCKIEHKIAQKLPVMFKFRLGSVEYVDWLEGK
jgi:hypothetical protein